MPFWLSLTNSRQWIKSNRWKDAIIIHFCFLRLCLSLWFLYWLSCSCLWCYWLNCGLCGLDWLSLLLLDRLFRLNSLHWCCSLCLNLWRRQNRLHWSYSLWLNRLNNLILWLCYNLGWLRSRCRSLWNDILRYDILWNHRRLYWLLRRLLYLWLYWNKWNWLDWLSLWNSLSWLNSCRLLGLYFWSCWCWLRRGNLCLWLCRCRRLWCNLSWLLLLLSVLIYIITQFGGNWSFLFCCLTWLWILIWFPMFFDIIW